MELVVDEAGEPGRTSSSGGSGTVLGDSAARESAVTGDTGELGGIAKYGTPVRYVRMVDKE